MQGNKKTPIYNQWINVKTGDEEVRSAMWMKRGRSMTCARTVSVSVSTGEWGGVLLVWSKAFDFIITIWDIFLLTSGYILWNPVDFKTACLTFIVQTRCYEFTLMLMLAVALLTSATGMFWSWNVQILPLLSHSVILNCHYVDLVLYSGLFWRIMS